MTPQPTTPAPFQYKGTPQRVAAIRAKAAKDPRVQAMKAAIERSLPLVEAAKIKIENSKKLMTRYPVDKVLAEIASAKTDDIYDSISVDIATKTYMIMARRHAFEMCELLIAQHILTEQFDDESEATHV